MSCEFSNERCLVFILHWFFEEAFRSSHLLRKSFLEIFLRRSLSKAAYDFLIRFIRGILTLLARVRRGSPEGPRIYSSVVFPLILLLLASPPTSNSIASCFYFLEGFRSSQSLLARVRPGSPKGPRDLFRDSLSLLVSIFIRDFFWWRSFLRGWFFSFSTFGIAPKVEQKP